MRSSSERAGFVCMSFALRGAPCGDDPNDTFDRLRGHHRKESVATTVANGQSALLNVRMVEIETRHSVRVVEGGPRFLKSDAMLLAIDPLLSLVPVELNHAADGNERRLSGDYLRLPRLIAYKSATRRRPLRGRLVAAGDRRSVRFGIGG